MQRTYRCQICRKDIEVTVSLKGSFNKSGYKRTRVKEYTSNEGKYFERRWFCNHCMEEMKNMEKQTIISLPKDDLIEMAARKHNIEQDKIIDVILSSKGMKVILKC